jgi:hypothetical protein
MAAFEVVVSSTDNTIPWFADDVFEIEASDHKEAIAVARKRWTDTVQKEWPDYEIDDIFIVPDGFDPDEDPFFRYTKD